MHNFLSYLRYDDINLLYDRKPKIFQRPSLYKRIGGFAQLHFTALAFSKPKKKW